jgi:hemoglobin
VAGQSVDAIAIRDAVKSFYARVLADPELSPLFDGVDMPALRSHQRKFLFHVLGGPDRYTGRDIKEAHRGLAITDRLFDLTIAHLIASLEEVGVAPDVVERATTDVAALRSLIVTALDGAD